ncbi:MAG: hypothetical protein AUJ98_07760 [Bacteroidetes bacterium CG2_30_33_31]|nr:MAG: hypothetical protein AUJ98_07760 [Bacteroidetes bacterium CG2_30_33_31]
MKSFKNELNLILDFLKLLNLSNNRDWFESNKSKYLEAKLAFEKITEFLMNEVSTFDRSFIPTKPQDYIFRIYKDVRFSKDKLPYKEQFGAILTNGGRKSKYAGYYFHIERDNSMAAGGIYCPEAVELKSVRTEILTNHKKFNEILSEADFKENFVGLVDIKLKRPPKGFPQDHPQIDLVKYKSYIYSKKFTDNQVLADNFIEEILNTFKAMKNMNSFINHAIDMIYEQ